MDDNEHENETGPAEAIPATADGQLREVQLGPSGGMPALPAIDIAAAIEAWWNDHFPGSPVAQVTACWNHAVAAKDELKRRLETLLTGAD